MPTTGEMITTAYEDILDIGGNAALATEHRQRILLHLRRAVDAVWSYRPFPFTFGSGTCTARAGDNTMFVPSDFFGVGPATKLWVQNDPTHIFFRHPPVVRNRLRRSPGLTSLRPEMWTLVGQGKLDTPAAPSVSVQGTPGASTYIYAVVAKFSDGGNTLPSATGQTTVGNALLTLVDFNRITWTAVERADVYDVYWTNGADVRRIAVDLSVLTFDHTSDTQGSVLALPTNDNSYRKEILFAPAAGSTDIAFDLTDYRILPPVLIDEVITPGSGNGDELKMVPEQYHECVLLPYLRRKLMGDEGDDREPMAEQEFKEELRDMWAEENPENLEAGMFPPGFYGSGSEED